MESINVRFSEGHTAITPSIEERPKRNTNGPSEISAAIEMLKKQKTYLRAMRVYKLDPTPRNQVILEVAKRAFDKPRVCYEKFAESEKNTRPSLEARIFARACHEILTCFRK